VFLLAEYMQILINMDYELKYEIECQPVSNNTGSKMLEENVFSSNVYESIIHKLMYN
jgi:hypothetical protein